MSVYPPGVGLSGASPPIDGAGEYEKVGSCDECGWSGRLDVTVDETVGAYVGACPCCSEPIVVDFDAPQPRRRIPRCPRP